MNAYEIPEKEIFVCNNCNNEVDENDHWCSNCGAIFEVDEKCDKHNEIAIGICLICKKKLCEECIIKVRNKYFCEKHSNYDFTESGWVCVYNTGEDLEAEIVKQNLVSNKIPCIIDSYKDHSFVVNVGNLSLIFVRVPFKYVLEAEKIISNPNKEHNFVN